VVLSGGAVLVLIESHECRSQVRSSGIWELGQSSKAEALVEAFPGGEALEDNGVCTGVCKSSQ